MALVICPGCGNLVSERAKTCPKCGYKFLKAENVINSTSSNGCRSETRMSLVILCSFAVFFFVVFFLNKVVDKGYVPSETDFYSTKKTNVDLSWHKTSKKSVSSRRNTVSTTSVFRHAQDVVNYLSSRSFSNGSNKITFRDMCLYTNDRCATGAINVISFNGTQAVLQAHSPFTGGDINFMVDKISGKLIDLSTGDVYN